MKLVLEKQKLYHKKGTRNISNKDSYFLGSLMLNAYKDTIDYEGESLEDAISEVKATLNGKYGRFMEDCSYLIEKDGKAISTSIITWFDEIDNPFLVFLMTHPRHKNHGLATYLLKKSINALLHDGHSELYLVVTKGNEPAEQVFKKIGFQIIKEWDI